MQVMAIIPARWASSRFPGKALAQIAGLPMIVRVWQRTCLARHVDTVLVATDDERIAEVCTEHGIDVTMTSPQHATGTDRLAEVAHTHTADVYVNVQGDEPVIDPHTIEAVVECLLSARESGVEVATAYLRGATEEQKQSPSTVHLLCGQDQRVMAFSRLAIPYCMKADYVHTVHVGLYAYTRDALMWFAKTPPGPVELAESIEPLRFLEHGKRIACVQVGGESIGVDEPQDVQRVEAILARDASPE